MFNSKLKVSMNNLKCSEDMVSVNGIRDAKLVEAMRRYTEGANVLLSEIYERLVKDEHWHTSFAESLMQKKLAKLLQTSSKLNDFEGNEEAKESNRKLLEEVMYSNGKCYDASCFLFLAYGAYRMRMNMEQPELLSEIESYMISSCEIDWNEISEEDVLKLYYCSCSDKSDSFIGSRQEIRIRLQDKVCYSPYNDQLINRSCQILFDSNRLCYVLHSVEKMLGHYDTQILWGKEGEEWSALGGRKMDAVYLSWNDSSVEHLDTAIREALDSLNENGVILLQDMNDYLASEECLEMRKYLVEENLIEAIYPGVDDLIPAGYVIAKKKLISGVFVKETWVGHNEPNPYKKEFTREFKTTELRGLGYSFSSGDLLSSLDYARLGERNYRLRDLLAVYEEKDRPELMEGTSVKVFRYKNFPSLPDLECAVDGLDTDENVKGMYRVVSPVLIMGAVFDEPKLAYVNASEEVPVYVSRSFLVYSVKEDVIDPHYFSCLLGNGLLKRYFDMNRDILQSCWTCGGPDGLYEDPGLPEKILLMSESIPVPVSKEVQQLKVREMSLLMQTVSEREAAQKKIAEQKEWLNEQHIRNVKHRLSDQLLPVHLGLNQLIRFLNQTDGVVHASDIISRSLNQNVETFLNSIFVQVQEMENTVKELTEFRSLGNSMETVNVSKMLQEYQAKSLRAKLQANLQLNIQDEDLEIRISRKGLTEVLDCLIENAIRHGFRDSARMDYCVRIDVSVTGNGMCRLGVANNGRAMSERAKEIYFERGSYAGDTGHSGIGGARVREITEAMGGQVNLSCNNEHEYPVQVELLFPVLNR